MSIPKVIHYCWFGGAPFPELVKKCMKSWEKYCPDYKIVCWNEENFDVNSNRYVKEAYEAKKWAFVSDYVRLYVVYENGGVYLDTDVELLKPLDSLIEKEGYMGYEKDGNISTGLGFACEKGNPLVKALLDDYRDIPFKLSEDKYDITPCPVRNTKRIESLGMDIKNKNSVFMGIRFLPEEYLCPMDYYTGRKNITKNTYSIHRYSASWTSAISKRTIFMKRLLGVRLYEKLYGKFLHRFNWLEW